MDEEISFRNDSDSMRMVRRSNPAVWTSASDDPHIPNGEIIIGIGKLGLSLQFGARNAQQEAN